MFLTTPLGLSNAPISSPLSTCVGRPAILSCSLVEVVRFGAQKATGIRQFPVDNWIALFRLDFLLVLFDFLLVLFDLLKIMS